MSEAAMTDHERARVKAEAGAAALQFEDVNDACPYPFTTPQGRLFRDHFIAVRAVTALQPGSQP